MEQSGQLAKELLELVPLDDDQTRAHKGVENGREEEHVEDEGRVVAPHAQQVDELHQVHRHHGQDEGKLAPVAPRSGVQHGQVAPHPHVDAHQANVLDCHLCVLSCAYSTYDSDSDSDSYSDSYSSSPADPLQTVPQSAEQMSFISRRLPPSRKAISVVAVDNINGIRQGKGSG